MYAKKSIDGVEKIFSKQMRLIWICLYGFLFLYSSRFILVLFARKAVGLTTIIIININIIINIIIYIIINIIINVIIKI